jgi:hypothetical protein
VGETGRSQPKFKPLGISPGEWFSLIAFICLLLLMLLGTAQQRLAESMFGRRDVPFDAVAWSQGTERYQMVDSMLKSHHLEGMDTNAILNLLGQPDKKSSSAFVYDLGRCPSCILNGALTLHLGGTVVDKIELTMPEPSS